MFFIHAPCFRDVYGVLCLFYLTTCVCVCHSSYGPSQEYLRARHFWASLLLHFHLCSFLTVLRALAVWIQNQKKNPLGSAPRAVPGYPINCETLLCVRDIVGGFAVWWHNKPKTKNQLLTPSTQCCFIPDSDISFPY